jgi:hypothetical protein
MEMLVNSKNDAIELLPAIPQSLQKGSVSGIKTRNRTTIEHLEWNLEQQKIVCRIKSDVDQKILLIQRNGILSISGNVTITPSALGEQGRYIELKAGETAGISLTIREEAKNLALYQPVKVSSVADNSPGMNAVDGNTGTRWSSAYTSQEWIYVDLGSPKKIDEVRLLWESAYGKSYKIQISDDAANWEDVYTERDGKGGIESIPLPALAGRYVRLQGIERATNFGYSLWELEVYGTNIPTSLATTEKIREIELFPNPVKKTLYVAG